jgi:hypothetical protein
MKTCLFVQVDLDNLEEYILLVVEATVKSGIGAQIEAFRAGFNQVKFWLDWQRGIAENMYLL